MIGERPPDQARSVVWDDTVNRIAHWRTQHGITADTERLGRAPDDRETFEQWHRLAVDVLDTAAYLVNKPTLADKRSSLAPAQLLARQEQLRRIIETAPAADRGIVDAALDSSRSARDLHAQLAMTVGRRGERTAWILEHWPHIVELEQLERIISDLDPLVLWPAAEAPEVQALLDQLRQIPEAIIEREARSLAELDRLEADANPSIRLQRRIDELTARAAALDREARIEGQASSDRRNTLGREVRRLRIELGQLDRSHADEALLDGYAGPSPEYQRSRLIRAANVSHAALTEQPDWVIDHVRQRHHEGRLANVSLRQVVERISAEAVERDGGAPTGSHTLPALPVEATLPGPS
jgi:hypothetical protein